MNEWRADELSAAEKKAFASLPRAREPLAEIEERTVAALKRRGDLVRWRKRTVWVAVASCLASVAMVAVILRQVLPHSQGSAREQPRWVLLLREGREDRSVPPEESRRRVSEYSSWARSASAKGLIDGEKLGQGGTLFTPGGPSPAVRTSASVSGFFLLGPMEEDAARALAAGCPHLKYGGEIELRRIESTSKEVEGPSSSYIYNLDDTNRR